MRSAIRRVIPVAMLPAISHLSCSSLTSCVPPHRPSEPPVFLASPPSSMAATGSVLRLSRPVSVNTPDASKTLLGPGPETWNRHSSVDASLRTSRCCT
ncbi:hypothetical protein K438DRAFT_461776 [Mycena galopus ATCC 62051]|nr:hypothetical protein K438DRAFT_461776 [Mycena galopus ATCC 62051]